MTTLEFSDQFDTIIDSYRRFKDFDRKEELDSLDFNEYEKSVFLTKALEQVVTNLYNGRLLGLSFEESEQLRRYLDALVKSESLNGTNNLYKLPLDLLFITLESCILQDKGLGCLNGKEVRVVPITQDDYHSIKNNPFKGAGSNRVLRLDVGDNTVKLISKFNIGKYSIMYLKKPKPIILANLNDLTIDKESNITECELNPAIHRMILDMAVLLALLSKAGKSQT